MYSTYDGAKKCAHELHNKLTVSGLFLPLNACQTAMAVAGGFRDWHDLKVSLDAEQRKCDPETFRRRLIEGLPACCRGVATAWLDRVRHEEDGSELPLLWYRHAFPYVLATASNYRSAAILRRGSGTGQKLREAIVLELIISPPKVPLALVDAQSLDLIYSGSLEEVFGQNALHHRFEVELKSLQEAGIITVGDGGVRVHSPGKERVQASVASTVNWKLENWPIGGGEGFEVLVDALSFAGLSDARATAQSLVAPMSTPSGSPKDRLLELLSELASEGQLQAFALICSVFSSREPRVAKLIVQRVPAKISKFYFAKHLRLDGGAIIRWAKKNNEWPDRLTRSLRVPDLFALEAKTIGEGIAQVSRQRPPY